MSYPIENPYWQHEIPFAFISSEASSRVKRLINSTRGRIESYHQEIRFDDNALPSFIRAHSYSFPDGVMHCHTFMKDNSLYNSQLFIDDPSKPTRLEIRCEYVLHFYISEKDRRCYLIVWLDHLKKDENLQNFFSILEERAWGHDLFAFHHDDEYAVFNLAIDPSKIPSNCFKYDSRTSLSGFYRIKNLFLKSVPNRPLISGIPFRRSIMKKLSKVPKEYPQLIKGARKSLVQSKKEPEVESVSI